MGAAASFIGEIKEHVEMQLATLYATSQRHYESLLLSRAVHGFTSSTRKRSEPSHASSRGVGSDFRYYLLCTTGRREREIYI